MKLLPAIRFLLLSLIILNSCTNHELEGPNDLKLNLRWVKNYPDEKAEDVVTGLSWNLSFLGARLPKGSIAASMKWINDDVLQVDFETLGFSSEASEAWRSLFISIRASEEYLQLGSIDIGRFTMLTLNSSYHYYAITGARPTFDDFAASYAFDGKKGAITNSSIAMGHRRVSFSIADGIGRVTFIAEEGDGSLIENNFSVEEFEVIDIMPNGQLRFAMYDKEKKLKPFADPSLTEAGKPSKCLWCHEINLQSLNVMEAAPGYYTEPEMSVKLLEARSILNQYRSGLSSDLDFTQTQAHAKGEILYVGFMEPSVFRLSGEWNVSEEQVQAQVTGFKTHQNTEYTLLGSQLFQRKDIEVLAPYKGLPVPDDAREPSAFEPMLVMPN